MYSKWWDWRFRTVALIGPSILRSNPGLKASCYTEGQERGYHITPAAALPIPEIGRALGAALRANYRGGTWFESTAAHHNTMGCN